MKISIIKVQAMNAKQTAAFVADFAKANGLTSELGVQNYRVVNQIMRDAISIPAGVNRGAVADVRKKLFGACAAEPKAPAKNVVVDPKIVEVAEKAAEALQNNPMIYLTVAQKRAALAIIEALRTRGNSTFPAIVAGQFRVVRQAIAQAAGWLKSLGVVITLSEKREITVAAIIEEETTEEVAEETTENVASKDSATEPKAKKMKELSPAMKKAILSFGREGKDKPFFGFKSLHGSTAKALESRGLVIRHERKSVDVKVVGGTRPGFFRSIKVHYRFALTREGRRVLAELSAPKVETPKEEAPKKVETPKEEAPKKVETPKVEQTVRRTRPAKVSSIKALVASCELNATPVSLGGSENFYRMRMVRGDDVLSATVIEAQEDEIGNRLKQWAFDQAKILIRCGEA